jgi:hypothetical protein
LCEIKSKITAGIFPFDAKKKTLTILDCPWQLGYGVFLVLLIKADAISSME